MVHFGGAFPGYISGVLAQPERGFGMAIMTNAWSGYEVIWEVFYSVLYGYGILPTTGQVLNAGYSLLLFLSALAVWPVSGIVRRVRNQGLPGVATERERQNSSAVARAAVTVTAAAVLVLTLLYRGPLCGVLVNAPSRGETVLTKALLGIFFGTPILLVALTVLVWKRRHGSIPEKVRYTVIALGAMIGVYLLRDLWGLMFWG
jgi:hypothetical protein